MRTAARLLIAATCLGFLACTAGSPPRFVGGKVQGLKGTGLVLATGTDSLPVSADGTFSFATALQEGTSYAITVATQPTHPNQDCSVSNGSGTVGSTDVTNVGVSCATKSYAVGGQVTGLNGSLVLQINHGETVTVTSSGAFTFPTPLPDQSTYAVELQQAPSNQRCTLSTGSGTIDGAPVTSVSVACQDLFTVGGTLTGAAGPVTVSFNGTSQTIPDNGPFTFPQQVLSGDAYAVDVVLAPANQQCTVSGGSGQVATADITDIAITCVTLYTVSGTLTGATDPVQLSLNGQPLTVPMDGPFTFPQTLLSGAAYAVAVTQAPPNEQCSVSGGSGTIGTSNITDVAITCLKLLTIGGQVSGGSDQVQLTLNGGAPFTVMGNGAFTFPQPLLDGSTYDVEVAQSPAGQQCTVSGGSGTLHGVDVSGVRVKCLNLYSVSGSVAGASGPITLSLNGVTQEFPSTGSIVFATQLADGSSYQVDVVQSPAGQQCTVTDGNGTVTGTNVITVAVSCVNVYTISGMLTGSSGPVDLGLNGGDLILNSDGPFTFSTPLFDATDYTVTVNLPPMHQHCVVTNGTGKIAGQNVTNVAVQCYRWYDLATFQASAIVLGQPDTTSHAINQGGGPSATTLNRPWGNMTVAGDHFWAPDHWNHRVLGYALPLLQNDQPAGLVLGQPDMFSSDYNTTKDGLNSPKSVVTDDTHFFVSDYGNNRVLIYDTMPETTVAAPDHVVGETSFTDSSSDCQANRLLGPEGIFVSGGKLFVADSGHGRVLVWNQIPTSDGVPADLVLGQELLDRCAWNDDNGDGVPDKAPTARTLYNPTDVWTDGVRLVIADSGNNRVLIWNTFPTQNGQLADLVLGQPDFQQMASGASASELSSPWFVTSTGLQLFVVDNGNNRVLVWNSFPTMNNQPADVVLGQADFTSVLANSNGMGGAAVSAKGLNNPGGLLLYDGRLWVADSDNNRLIAFESP